MKLVKKTFNELTTKELYEILKARAEIFVVEQNCIYQDLDNLDYRSLHIFFQDNSETVVAYLRLYPKNHSTNENTLNNSPLISDTIQMGRVLTLTHGTGLGKRLLQEGIKAAQNLNGIKKIFIEAQVYATGFYSQAGFVICSEEFLEDGIPHVCMELLL